MVDDKVGGTGLRGRLVATGCLAGAVAAWGCSAGGGTDDANPNLQSAGGQFSSAGAAGFGNPAGTAGHSPLGAGGAIAQPGGSGGYNPGGAGAPPAGSGGSNVGTPTGLLPCAVADVVSRNCAECHGSPPGPGPMSLATVEEFHKNSTVNGNLMRSLVQQRINNAANPMPPANSTPMSAADKATLEGWLASGAMPGAQGDACPVTKPTGGPNPPPPPPPPPGAKCYELRNHGSPTSGDTSPYSVRTGEHYVEFHFDAPYDEPSVMVSWRTLYDKQNLLHHWLFYNGGTSRQPDGAIVEGIGSHVFQNVELMAGWAVGGNEMELPRGEGVAAALPPPGGKMFVEWHYWNSTGSAQQDRSGIEICVVPASTVDASKVAGVTWIGSEALSMPAGRETTVRASCTPSFRNVPAGEPIRIFGFNPHMHTIGSHMRTWILRANGMAEKIFDKPFRFDNQLNYPQDPMFEVRQGDKIINDCTFTNNTNRAIGFGPSSDAEMCYQFTFSYPQGALANGVFSLTGATNTCWDGIAASCPGCVP